MRSFTWTNRNIDGTTIQSALGIEPDVKLLGLSDKAKASLKNKLSKIKQVMIDEILMVSRIEVSMMVSRIYGLKLMHG